MKRSVTLVSNATSQDHAFMADLIMAASDAWFAGNMATMLHDAGDGSNFLVDALTATICL